MSFYNLTAALITLAVVFAYLSYRWFKIPATIGIMCAALLISLSMILLSNFGYQALFSPFITSIKHLPFNDVLVNGMLGFLLFAGAMTVDLEHLKKQGWEIVVLSMLGTLASTILIALALYYILALTPIHLPFVYCLLFGALISPTDPIAVLAIFKSLKAPAKMMTILEGESLFNDGIGIVIFLTVYQAAFTMAKPDFSSVSLLFLQETCGGLVSGFLLGLAGMYLIRTLDNARLVILLTLALVAGGYTLIQELEMSGPLAMVVVGLMIGNIPLNRFKEQTIKIELAIFWNVIDEILNAVLFLLIGFELLVLPLALEHLYLVLFTIPLVLGVRYLTVALPMRFFAVKKHYYPHFVAILTWGGLRGGLAIALALALPRSEYRDIVLQMTYMVVLFAIVVQGLTMKSLVKCSLKEQERVSKEVY